MSSASVTKWRLQREVFFIRAGRLCGGWRFCCCFRQQHHRTKPQRNPDVSPGSSLMSYLVQVWRGVPQSGGLGWVTYGGPVSEARAYQLLALSQRIRPQHPHKLETISPG